MPKSCQSKNEVIMLNYAKAFKDFLFTLPIIENV
jgi:hypothetical protein